MKGFAQKFWCPCVIFRAGPDCGKYGDPWEYAVVIEFPWIQIIRKALGLKATAMIWALSADGKLTLGHARAAFEWIKSQGYSYDWERIKDNVTE